MSIATYEFFKALGGKLVYTNVARPARLIDMNNDQTEDCGHRLGIKEFLAGYGFESRKADDELDRGGSAGTAVGRFGKTAGAACPREGHSGT